MSAADFMQRARAAGRHVPDYCAKLAAEDISKGNLGDCAACSQRWPVSLLDAKPDDPANPDSCDWTRLECPPCYGPDWAPM